MSKISLAVTLIRNMGFSNLLARLRSDSRLQFSGSLFTNSTKYLLILSAFRLSMFFFSFVPLISSITENKFHFMFVSSSIFLS